MDYQLILIRGRSASKAIPLGDGVTVAGRQEDCRLRIASSQVSRRHCQIFEQKGYLIVKDLGSSNGTYVNDKRIKGQQVLEPGDELTVGPVRFKIEKLSPPATPTPGKKKSSETAVGASPASAADKPIPIDDEDLIQVEIDGSDHTTPAVKATPGKAGAAPTKSAQAETIEFGEEDAADFLLELDIDDKEHP